MIKYINKELPQFITNSEYVDPVDIKKLKFIFLAIKRYSDIRNKSFNDLSILEVGCGKGGICLAMAAVGRNFSASLTSSRLHNCF